MNITNELVEILYHERRRGPMILKQNYEMICDFIFSTLKMNGEISLTDLLHCANEKLAVNFKGDLNWSILQVKQDLEVRGLLTITMDRKRIQIITLNKSAAKKLNVVEKLVNSNLK